MVDRIISKIFYGLFSKRISKDRKIKKMSGMPGTPVLGIPDGNKPAFSMPDTPVLGIPDGNKPAFSMPGTPVLGIPDGNKPSLVCRALRFSAYLTVINRRLERYKSPESFI